MSLFPNFIKNNTMDITETKKNLHAYIDVINDETQIELLNEAASGYASKQPDIIEQLNPAN